MTVFLLILAVLGILFILVCLGASLLIEPIIAILLLYGVYKLVSYITDKGEKS